MALEIPGTRHVRCGLRLAAMCLIVSILAVAVPMYSQTTTRASDPRFLSDQLSH